MMTRQELAVLKRSMWPSDAVRPVRMYAVLDCARDPAIFDLVHRSYREKSCLFAGTIGIELERAAPHLLELHPGDAVTDELLQRGWQNAWGVFVRSESSFASLRRHLRTLLRVRTEDDRFLLFRFFDPRVLNMYLPTCTHDELRQIFGDTIVAVHSACMTTAETYRFSVDRHGLHRSGLSAELAAAPGSQRQL